ncbi:single-stranded DNA-binding protein [Nonomuraea zeae]|nr:single-stranded DNA-binding protein [Nonomuraea zeae]
MNDIYITLTGNVAAEPRQYSFDDGSKVTSLKVFSSHRYFDKRTGQWTDGDRVCFTVRCWRTLGDNVAASVRAGHPVVVSGKLRIREFGAEGDRRFVPEIEASAVGHDLRWGSGVFTKPDRAGGAGSMSKEMRDQLDEETRDWAMGSRTFRPLARQESAPGTAHPGADHDTVRTLGPDSHSIHASGPEGDNPNALELGGGDTRATGPDGGNILTLGGDGDTVRILGADDLDPIRAGGAEGDGDAEQAGLADERVAA